MRRTRGTQAVYDESFESIQETSLIVESTYSVLPVLPDELPLDSWRYRYIKRAFDVVCALLMMVVFFVPGLLIATLIWFTSDGSVFYREKRIGRDGVPFRIWKFRSMRPHGSPPRGAGVHGEHIVLQWRIDKHENDPRITRIGHFLRRWSLDELPQVFNVLRGEMSLVGPRPVVKAETYLYKHLLPYYLAATPGLSGLWQVSGRSDLDYVERAKLDASYVQNWSLRADLGIFFRTIPAVLGRVGAR